MRGIKDWLEYGDRSKGYEKINIIDIQTYHIRCIVNRNSPGTTRSSDPTDHRRRNTTIPGILEAYKLKKKLLLIIHL